MKRSAWLTFFLIIVAAGLGAGVGLYAIDLFPGVLTTADGSSSTLYRVRADAKGMPQLVTPQGASVTPVPGAAGSSPVVRLAGVKSDTPSSALPGIYLRLPDPFEQAASGQKVRVTIFARHAADAPNASFAVAYSTSEVGNSGWHKFDLTDQLSRYSFTFNVPTMVKGLGDYIGILPDPTGADGSVEIAEIVAEAALRNKDFPPLPELTSP